VKGPKLFQYFWEQKMCIFEGEKFKRVSIRRFFKTAHIFAAVFILHTSFAHAAFQQNLWGARPSALGGAFTALADDANAPAYNPAGISLTTSNELTLMYARLYAGLDFAVGDESSRLGLGYIGLVPQIADRRYGSYAFSWNTFVATKLYREDTFAMTIADSYQFDSLPNRPILSYGTNIKLLRRSFSTDMRTENDAVFNSGRDSSALTMDLGLIAQPRFKILPGLKFGLAAQNLTEPDIGLASTDRVPLALNFGVAYQDRRMRYFNPALEVSRRRGRTVVSGAYEGWFAGDALALRLGGNADQLGAGLGTNFALTRSMKLRLDYSIQWPLSVAGSDGSHRVSITTNF